MARYRFRRDRDHSPISSLDELVRVSVSPMPSSMRGLLSDTPVLSEIEDRRFFHPEQDDAPALTISRSTVSRTNRLVDRLVTAPGGAVYRINSQTKARLGFDRPSDVATCVRRHQRREVLHALNKIRSGRGSKKRRSWRSDFQC